MPFPVSQLHLLLFHFLLEFLQELAYLQNGLLKIRQFHYFVEQEKPGNITSEEEKHLVDIFKAVGKIWDGVGEAAAYAAAIGAVAAGA